MKRRKFALPSARLHGSPRTLMALPKRAMLKTASVFPSFGTLRTERDDPRCRRSRQDIALPIRAKVRRLSELPRCRKSRTLAAENAGRLSNSNEEQSRVTSRLMHTSCAVPSVPQKSVLQE